MDISLLNSQVKMMKKSILQNKMAFDILITVQVRTCELSKQNATDSSANVSSALQDLASQISAMSDSAVSFMVVLENQDISQALKLLSIRISVPLLKVRRFPTRATTPKIS